jgi:DNA-binding Lrp family transcriptional regulator
MHGGGDDPMNHIQNGFHPLDIRILEMLQKDGRMPNVQLAAAVGLSPSAVLERVRKLEERGVIERYVTLVDNKKVGLGTIAFVAVSLNLHQQDSIDNFHRFVRESGHVLECYHVAGGEDYLLKVYARDIDDYEQFLLSSLTRTRGIDKVKTMFVLSTLKRETAVPLTSAAEGARNGSNGEAPAKRGKAGCGACERKRNKRDKATRRR